MAGPPRGNDVPEIFFPILGYLILFPDSLLGNVAKAAPEFTKDMNSFNNPSLREVPLSSAMTTGTARGFAKLYGIIANGGKLGDQHFLSDELITSLSTPLVTVTDGVTRAQNVSFGPGTSFKANPKGQYNVGHTGHGGQVAMADLTNGLGIAYLTNLVSIYGMGDDPRYRDLKDALYRCLDKYLETLNR